MTGATPDGRSLAFVKMHGLGNDYVHVDAFERPVPDPVATARRVSDRHRGVGSDGLILLLPPEGAGHVRMRMWNADGSEAQMCGNGVRCLCKQAHDSGRCRANPMRVETGAGVLELEWTAGADGTVERVRVDMGPPRFALASLPADEAHLAAAGPARWRLRAADRDWDAVLVSMGNPHAVMIVDDADAIDLAGTGRAFETHPAFPERINAHFVTVRSRTHVVMRTWERGSGATQACGTGASAVAVATALLGRTERRITATLPGGDLELEWTGTGPEDPGTVLMTGPAETSFTGTWTDPG